MFAANSYVIRPARKEDGFALRRLAELDSQSPLTGRIIVGEIGGMPAAAMSLDEWRVVGGRDRRSSALRVHLRLRAAGIEAHRRMPAVRDRLRAGLRRPADDEAKAA